jgi:hypothetical protein
VQSCSISYFGNTYATPHAVQSYVTNATLSPYTTQGTNNFYGVGNVVMTQGAVGMMQNYGGPAKPPHWVAHAQSGQGEGPEDVADAESGITMFAGCQQWMKAMPSDSQSQLPPLG